MARVALACQYRIEVIRKQLIRIAMQLCQVIAQCKGQAFGRWGSQQHGRFIRATLQLVGVSLELLQR